MQALQLFRHCHSAPRAVDIRLGYGQSVPVSFHAIYDMAPLATFNIRPVRVVQLEQFAFLFVAPLRIIRVTTPSSRGATRLCAPRVPIELLNELHRKLFRARF